MPIGWDKSKTLCRGCISTQSVLETKNVGYTQLWNLGNVDAVPPIIKTILCHKCITKKYNTRIDR